MNFDAAFIWRNILARNQICQRKSIDSVNVSEDTHHHALNLDFGFLYQHVIESFNHSLYFLIIVVR